VKVLEGVDVGVDVAVKLFVQVEVAILVNVELTVAVKVKVGVLEAVDVKVLVAVGEKVDVAVAVAGCGIIWIACTTALSALAGPKVMVMTPPEGAILLKTSSMALFCPPVVAKISKLVSTCVPFTETLKTLCPAAVQ
jgi:hypothetical protein